MTKRDDDSMDKMTKMDRTDNCRRKSPSRAENGRDLTVNSDVHSPGKNTVRQSSSGSFSEFSASSFRESPRSAPSSLPGSRCGSTPGSRLASRSNSQESIIDLFDSMTLQFGQQLSEGPGQGIQLFSPKPRPLRHPKWSWQERVRVNHAIWRSWHMQYVKGKKPVVCQFATPTPDARQRLQADVIQGRPINKQWNPTQISSAIRDYHKWRVFSRDVFMGDGRSPEDNAINLDMPHPPLSPMSAQKLINDDMLKDFSDTLFISTEKKNFTVPAPKKITRHVYNSDIIQPGLMQLEPDFDQDFMDTLNTLQEYLSKTPTKPDVESVGLSYNLPPNLLPDTSLGSFSEAMEIIDSNKTSATDSYPVAIIANNNGKPIINQRSVTFAATPGAMLPGQIEQLASGTGLQTSYSGPTSSFSGPTHTFTGATSTTPLYHPDSLALNQNATAPMDGVRSGMQQQHLHIQQHQQQQQQQQQLAASISQVHNLMHVLTSSPSSMNNSSGVRSPQSTVPMATASSYQTQATTWAMSQMSTHTNQGFTYVQPKMESPSPTPKSPPSCMQTMPMSQGATGSNMGATNANMGATNTNMGATNANMGATNATIGAISEAVDLLSCQLLSSPSRMLPDWTTQLQLPQSPNWSATGGPTGGTVSGGDLNSSGNGGTAVPKTSVAGGTFLSFNNLDPMAPMDQNTVLGQRSFGGDLSPGHQQQHQQQQQQHLQSGLEIRNIDGLSPQSQPSEELMDFEQYSGIAIATGASGMTMYKQPKREVASPYSSSQNTSRSNSKANSRANSRPSSRGNSRANSRAGSPRASYAGLSSQPLQETLQAALQGKSDVKELGLRSPSTDRDLTISVPSSCQASTASSAASSPGSQIDLPDTPTSVREFEFHPPKAKRQKTPDSGTKEKEARRRIKHLHSEHKRRFNIQTGLDELQGMIPSLSNGGGDNNSGSKVSTATMLQKGHEYMLRLKEETNKLRGEVEKAREEIQRVNDEICECQDSLPDTGAPVNAQSERQMQQMCNEYINQRMRENWKFWIFSMLVKPLFASYVTAVCSNPGANFETEVVDWVEESCRLKPLRKLVYTIVRQVSTRTSVLQSPSKLPEEIKQLVEDEISKPSMDQS